MLIVCLLYVSKIQDSVEHVIIKITDLEVEGGTTLQKEKKK